MRTHRRCFFFQAEDGIRDWSVTGVQTCALPIWQGLYADHAQNLTISDFCVSDAAGHGIYLADTIQTARLTRLTLSAAGNHAPLFQLNSESGQGITDVTVSDSVIEQRDLNPQVGVVNVMGAGLPIQPIEFQRVRMKGGR